MIPWFIVQLCWWLAPRLGRWLRVEWTHGRIGADRLQVAGRCHPHALPWAAARRAVWAARSRYGTDR